MGRVFVIAAAGLAALVGVQSAIAARHRTGLNPIQRENAKPGTTSWQIAGLPSTNIEGYASEISARPGQVLHLHVSVKQGRYQIQIYRLGWYHGKGGRRLACLPSCRTTKAGKHFRTPEPSNSTGELDAGWPVTDRIRVTTAWTTGYYVAKLVATSGRFRGQASYVFFIVRASAGHTTPILVQASVNTWEAYNNWGGKSLYSSNSSRGVAATHVSFNRPFTALPNTNPTPLTWEVALVRFLERDGYDVSYQTDVDTDSDPSSLLRHRLDIVSGHDEYWSKAMRDGYDAARAHGVNLAFIGGDIGTWQIRYGDAHRTIIEYRSATADPDPNQSEKTVMFQDLTPPRPECEILGIGFHGGVAAAGRAYPFRIQSAAGTDPWFHGTSLRPGDTLDNAVGYEWDAIQPGCAVPPVKDLMHWHGPCGGCEGTPTADAVTYRASSGARVFSDGTLNLTWMLDSYGSPGFNTDSRVQKLFAHVFNALDGPTA